MGKLNRFEILLNNPNGVCYAGHYIDGEVMVVLNKAMTMRGIRAKFSGRSQVSWAEGSDSGGYFEARAYLADELILFGKGLHGKVWYWITCTIDKPWKFNHTTKTAFTVLKRLDLNKEPEALIGIRNEEEKSVGCWCCKSGPISCTFQLDRRGYVPGESIPIKAEIINHSNRRIFKTTAALHMETTYNSGKNTAETNVKLVEQDRGEILPGHSDKWTGQGLLIPPTTPSYLSGCSLIDIRYYVQLSVHISGPSRKLRVPIGVIIGTIPISHRHGVRPPSRAPVSIQPYKEAGLTQGSSSPNTPPHFADSAFGTVDVRDEEDSKTMKGNMNYTQSKWLNY